MQSTTSNLKRGTGIALAVAALFAAQPASAAGDQIELAGWWANAGGGNVSITFDGTNYHNGTHNSFTEAGGAGGFNTFDLTNTGPSFQSWCVDIFRDFNFPIMRTDILTPAVTVFSTNLGPAVAAKKDYDLERLYTNVHAAIDNRGAPTTTNSTAAFQLAVWEIVNEKSGNLYDLSKGDLKITSNSAGYATAQGWLQTLNTVWTPVQYSANIWAVQGQGPGPFQWGAQDVAVFAPIPEPETYAMIIAGLGLMGFVARRRQQLAVARPLAIA